MRRLDKLKELQGLHPNIKYEDIYRIVYLADVDDLEDYSLWLDTRREDSARKADLFLHIRSVKLGKFIWVTNDKYDGLFIEEQSFNQRDKDHKKTYFRNKSELADYLYELLRPCI